jgi:hypothetical protein
MLRIPSLDLEAAWLQHLAWAGITLAPALGAIVMRTSTIRRRA